MADVYPPVLIDGAVADNDPAKYFVGGVILQRPSLLQVGNIVYGAFGGHCDLFNYTGVIVGVDITAAKVVTQFAMESGPLAEQTNALLTNGAGGEAGIWMSGMGIASDGDRLFVVTGNGAVSLLNLFWLSLITNYRRLTKTKEPRLLARAPWQHLDSAR